MLVRLIYVITAAVACFLAILSAFLPWVSLDVRLPIVGSIGTLTRSGYEGDGAIVLVLGLVAVGFAAYLWFERSLTSLRLVSLFNTVLGAVIFATAIVNLSDTQRALGDAQRQLGLDLTALVGVDPQSLVDTREGIYVALASGVVLASASLLLFSLERFSPTSLTLQPGQEADQKNVRAEDRR